MSSVLRGSLCHFSMKGKMSDGLFLRCTYTYKSLYAMYTFSEVYHTNTVWFFVLLFPQLLQVYDTNKL